MLTANIILALLLIAGASAGYHRGFLKDGEWIIGMILGLLLYPLISTPVITLLLKIIPGSYVVTQFEVLNILIQFFLKIVAFAVIVKLARLVVSNLLPSDKYELGFVGRTVDGIAGALFGLIKVCIAVWIIDALLKMNASLTASVTLLSRFNAALAGSRIYGIITAYNPLYGLFAAIPYGKL